MPPMFVRDIIITAVGGTGARTEVKKTPREGKKTSKRLVRRHGKSRDWEIAGAPPEWHGQPPEGAPAVEVLPGGFPDDPAPPDQIQEPPVIIEIIPN
jgi:hypothetical protein